MHFFSFSVQFSAVALLLLPALFASAHPHLHDRSNSIPSNEIKLIHPAGGAGDITTLKLKTDRHSIEPDGTFYEFNWKEPGGAETRATATRISETTYEMVVDELKARGTFITSGPDDREQLWVVEKGWVVEDEGVVEGGTLLGGTTNRRGHAK